MVAYSKSVGVTMCLGVGLVLRDLHLNQFQTGSADQNCRIGDASTHVVQSVLNWGHYQALLSACRDLLEDMEICFELTLVDTPATSLSSLHNAAVDDAPSKKAREEETANQESLLLWDKLGRISCHFQMTMTFNQMFLNHS
jgi:hypothetical protein